MEIKHILAPTDFSSCSRHALDYAVLVAQKFGARLDVLSVWELPIGIMPDWIVTTPGQPTQAISALIRGRADTELAKLVGELRRGFENVHGLIETGDPAETIVAVAARGHYGLVVMGTHGRTGLSHLWSGSVAETVVRRAGCAVLTVRETEKKHE